MTHVLEKFVSVLFVIGTLFSSAQAQQLEQPAYLHFQFDDNAIINNLSDNGAWAAAHGANASNSLLSTGPRLLDLSTGGVRELTEGMSAASLVSASAYDVTDDGKIVVGELNGAPAYWSAEDGKWHQLPLRAGVDGGMAMSITPDGSYAVGILNYSADVFSEQPALWNLKSGELISLQGLPTLDMAHEDKGQNRFISISTDGKTILGCMSVSYLPSNGYLGGRFNYLYDREKKTYTVIGFTESQTERWAPHADGLMFLSTAMLSNNGKYVTGAAYVAREVAGSEFPNEFETPYIYDVTTGKFTLHDATPDQGIGGWAVSNEGIMLGASPINNPYREWSIRAGKYWYDIRHVLREKYDFNLLAQVGIDNSGTPLAISNDGTRIAVIVDPYHSYVLQLPEKLQDACKGIDLLGNYTATPTPGAAFSQLQNASIRFDREIEVLGAATAAEIQKADGSRMYNSVAFRVGDDGKTLNITFRRGNLNAGEQHTLFIPAGSICVAGDAEQTNSDIRISYTGRSNTPIVLSDIYPANGSSVAKMDGSTNPILLTFDTQVMSTGEVPAWLYREGETEPISQLLMAYAGKQVAIYPAATQLLYKGAKYRVEIPAGAITDLTGNCGNEQISLNYNGAYEREVAYDDKTLFKDDFSNGFAAFMLFDGDRQTPIKAMQEWGFADAQNYPWTLVRDNEASTDLAAASHSMYEEGTASQDWMVTPQIYLPDERCTLTFQSQSYMQIAEDRLKIIVWQNDNVYQVLTDEIVQKILSEGTVVYNEIQSCGKSEEGLDGEWTNNKVDLKKFAGKNIYICFLNDNENQSAVMVDNVEVSHNIPYLVTFDHEIVVTAKSSINIRGRITIDSEEANYQSALLTLKQADGTVVSRISRDGLSLTKGDVFQFEFEQPLPLTAGRENKFLVEIQMGEDLISVSESVKNLAFEPKKHVVLEEFSGMTCQNCPLGILAVEKIKQLYGERFIPLVLHTYQGDPLGTGLDGYSSYFNFSGAPQGMIQRNGVLSAPMMSNGQDYTFNGLNGEKLWLDLVTEELQTPAEAEISAVAAFADETQKQIVVPCTVKYALDAADVNVNLFLAILEDEVSGFQYNNLYTQTDPDLGEWGEGGEFAKSTVYPYLHHHVVRGWVGRTVVGTGGYIPASVTANTPYNATITAEVPSTVANKENLSVVVMMINANTERVVNATVCKVAGTIDHIGALQTESDIQVFSTEGWLTICVPEAKNIEVFAADGRLLGSNNHQETLKVGTRGLKGMVLVKAATPSGVKVKKLLLP